MEFSWRTQILLVWMVVCMENVYNGVQSVTDSQDAAVLRSLKDQWQYTPPSWDVSNDPCDSKWEGVICEDSRVIELRLSTMGLSGQLGGDIGHLAELRSIDLSFNTGLTGPVSSKIGNLQKLTILILAGCGFTGNIPSEIGNLKQLSFLTLYSNKFTGHIPPSLGGLSNLYWFDIADNQLTGSLPVSTPTSPGLDQLINAKHFHFNKNKLSGTIPERLFSSGMVLIHLLFDGNQFTGSIPSTLGLVHTLEVVRLDRNALDGPVPSSLSNLTQVNDLNLAHNQLTGPVPDLTQMSSLNYVDLSNNSFDVSEAPSWFSTMQSLTTLVMEYGELRGPVPQKLFSCPQLQQVKLKHNGFNSTLNMGDSISPSLQLVDLENNDLTSVTLGPSYKNTLKLLGNPVCSQLSESHYCRLQQQPERPPYKTALAHCVSMMCPPSQSLSPLSCECAYPYVGTLYFRAPSFRVLSSSTEFQSLETVMSKELGLKPGSVSLQDLHFNTDDYLVAHLELFPSNGKYFTRSEIQRIGFDLTNQTFKPPHEFGPYYFKALPYAFPDIRGGSPLSIGLIIGIAVGCALLVLMVVGIGVYAFRQKKRAERAIKRNKPFGSWESNGPDSGGIPQLKGARFFTYDELKTITNNFSESNEIGSGGYGKVYKGILPNQKVLAIKRAQQESVQGGLEFKTEIELLSRVHHKNLVSLVGFCFEQGEQMLVYEYVPKGTLRECLSGRSGIHLNWKRRLRVALGSAKGLAYLHEHADPPIIHRDVKSSNILLDEDLNAKVADFGLSKLAADCLRGHISTQVKGTMGYLDPEYYLTQQLSLKSDVYSFGVVLLELVTAKQPIVNGVYIVREVKNAMNANDELYGLAELIDPVIRVEENLAGFKRFIELAMQCVRETAVERPTMSDLVKEIEAMLHSEGLNTATTSAASSATDYGCKKDAPRHPYWESLSGKEDITSGAFDYSGASTFSYKVEPK